jgi:hypothetical protein
MKHVSVDALDESVKRFVLSLSKEASGSVLELNGRPVVRVLPAGAGETDSTGKEQWTEERNVRRCALIDRKIDGTLTTAEAEELAVLQSAMLRHRRRVAPLPLDDARRLHQQLLSQPAPDPVEAE